MGQPARRIQASQATLRTPRLRLVDTPPARAPRPCERASAHACARAEEARARSAFTVFVLVFLCAVALGGARLTLTTRAAEYSLSENSLLADIRQQRVTVDRLEVDRSVLSTMSMGEPRSVNYVAASDIAPAGETAAASAGPVSAAGMQSAPGVFERVVQAVVELSAGEAQSLLVGDLGLAGSR
jgi:hypothetical protein